MAIDTKPGSTISDYGYKARFYLNAMCESKKFPYIVAGAAFAGISMIIGSLAMTAVSGGTATPFAMLSLVVGSLLLGGAVIAGLLFGANKLIDKFLPKENPEQREPFPPFFPA